MKRMVKNQDGYVLAYVLVIVLVLSMIAVGASASALSNNKTQKASISYTQDKYEAEGIIERFVAELEEAAITVATTLDKQTLATIKEEISAGFKTELGDNEPEVVDGIVDAIMGDGYEIDLQCDIYDFVPHTSGPQGEPQEGNQSTPNSGYFLVRSELTATSGSVAVDAEIDLKFTAVETDSIYEKYQITNVSVQYKSYNISTVEGGEGS